MSKITVTTEELAEYMFNVTSEIDFCQKSKQDMQDMLEKAFVKPRISLTEVLDKFEKYMMAKNAQPKRYLEILALPQEKQYDEILVRVKKCLQTAIPDQEVIITTLTLGDKLFDRLSIDGLDIIESIMECEEEFDLELWSLEAVKPEEITLKFFCDFITEAIAKEKK